jgi:predicted dehydrogenase
MKLVVLGELAAEYAATAAQQTGVEIAVVADQSDTRAREMAEHLGVENWSTDLFAVATTQADTVVILGSDVDRAAEIAHHVVHAGRAVILADVPASDESAWIELAGRAGDRLTLSRPLRFDPLFATTRAATQAGDVGTPRTVRIAWTFDRGPNRRAPLNPVTLATELADVAVWLLGEAPSAVYALMSDVDGPPLMQINLRTATGSLALLEATIGVAGFPRLRDLGLQASDGALYHRTLQDDLLWTTDGAEVLTYGDDALTREVAAWTSGLPSATANLARGSAIRHNLTIARAIAVSLTSSQPAVIEAETEVR